MGLRGIESTLARLSAPEFMANSGREILWIELLGRDGEVLGVLSVRGGISHVELSLPQLARRLVRTESAFLFMAHNHPSGDPRPSRADINATRTVWRLTRMLGISLQDHVILSDTGSFSFRAHGLL